MHVLAYNLIRIGSCQERWRLCRRLGGQFQLSRLSDEIISWRVYLYQIRLFPATN